MTVSPRTSAGVHSFDEWTTLKDVLVGRAEDFTAVHLDCSFNAFYWENVRPFLASKGFFRDHNGHMKAPQIAIDPWIVDELTEDIEGLVTVLETLDVSIERPAAVVGNQDVQSPFWQTIQSAPLNVRDQAIVLGTDILETAPHVRARTFENDYLKPVFYRRLREGTRWLCMPRPTLTRRALDTSGWEIAEDEQAVLADEHAHHVPGLGTELVFDGAQCIRLGRDVLVNVGSASHELGYAWLVAVFGDKFRFHRLDRLADSHLDSTLLPLRPGLWLVRTRDVLRHLPAPFSQWDYVIAPEMADDRFPTYERASFAIASRHIDMNILSISEDTVIVNSLYPELIGALEHKGFTVVPVRHRHRRLCGGGFHCVTLDLRRAGGLESYE